VIVSPYFVPGDDGVERLRSLRAAGLRVRVLTNSLGATDVTAVYAGYARYREALLEAGVELYEVKPTARSADSRAASGKASKPPRVPGSSRGSLHAKTIVFDCERLFVGSMNVDPRSVFTNTEIGVIIDAPEIASGVCGELSAGMPKSAYRIELQRPEGGKPQLEWVALEDGRESRTTSEPDVSAWRRFQAWFFSLLPIEPLL
jgi:putative cardiolipin synthase